MAATPILATICAERLTKFLTRYSKVHTGLLRCSYPVEAAKAKSAPPTTVRVVPVERKFSLWQSSEQQYQVPSRYTPFKPIFSFAQGRDNTQSRESNLSAGPKVSSVSESMLSGASRRIIADYIGLNSPKSPLTSCCRGQPRLDQSVAQSKARYKALANYANSLLNSKTQENF